MEYQVEIKQVESQTTAVVRRRAGLEQLTWVVPQACGEVWEFIRSSNLPHPGRNLALYLDDEIHLEVGVEVFQPFDGNEWVICSKTPAGLVATTVHIGPYDRLPEPHQAIRRWCAENGHTLAGPNWETYGHWDDDPARLRTDVFYLLRADGESDESDDDLVDDLIEHNPSFRRVLEKSLDRRVCPFHLEARRSSEVLVTPRHPSVATVPEHRGLPASWYRRCSRRPRRCRGAACA